MPALPWKTFRNVTREREYVVLLSELPLKSYLANPGFLRFSRQVQRQLSNAPGLLGYSLLARIVRKKFWTLSVWESERALMEFVHAEPHQNVMTALQSDMGATRLVRWTIQGAAYPPTWDEAFARTTQQPQGGTSPPV